MLKSKHTDEQHIIIFEVLAEKIDDLITNFYNSHKKKYPMVGNEHRLQIMIDALKFNIIDLLFHFSHDKETFAKCIRIIIENIEANSNNILAKYDELKAEK